MQTVKKRNFHFKDVEKYKEDKINDENIRNLLKILLKQLITKKMILI